MQEILTKYPAILATMLAFSVLEWAWARFYTHRAYDVGAGFASIGVAVGQYALKPLTAGLIGLIYGVAAQATPFHLPIGDWRVWAVGFVAVEFAYYWFHRWSHTVNLLWATHAVHHSANELTLPAAVRLGWTGVLSGGWLVFLPLVLLGFPPELIALLLAINLLYQFGLHTEAIRHLWGPIELVFNTPSHHRAHHSSEGPWLDCNFGGILIVFDRLFGTFVAEPRDGGLRYGLTDPIHSHNPFVIAFRQWGLLGHAVMTAPTWRQRAHVLLGPPGGVHVIPGEGTNPAGRLPDPAVNITTLRPEAAP